MCGGSKRKTPSSSASTSKTRRRARFITSPSQDLAVRLEERIYTQSIADASGVMAPKSTTPAFFAITGTGSGGRNNLAPDNKWNVLVVRVESEPAEKINK